MPEVEQRSPLRRLLSSLSRSIVAVLGLLGLVLALMLLLAATTVWRAQQEARQTLEARLSSATYVASAHVGWLMEATFQSLGRIETRVTEQLRAEHALPARIDELVPALPVSVHILVLDAHGKPIASNLKPAQIDESGADWFSALEQGRERYIGSMISDPVTGEKVFPVSERIDIDGKFSGVAAILVPADLMAQFWGSMQLGPDSSVGLVREDGWLVARYPIPPQPLDLSKYVLFTQYLTKSSKGLYEAPASPADGIARLVSYQRVPGLPLVVAVGVPLSELSGTLWRNIGGAIVLTLPFGIGLLFLSSWLVIILRREDQARRGLSQALEQNRVLFREIHHRVKNNLQMVSSLVRMQPGPSEGKEDLSRRISAMAAIHEHLYTSDRFSEVSLPSYVGTVVQSLQASAGEAVSIDCQVEPMTTHIDIALPLGLILNEVVTNSLKHAFPGEAPGRIEVSLSRIDAERARLVVKDNGVGFSDPPQRDGLGSRLIKALSDRLDAKATYTGDAGTTFTLELPLVTRAGRAAAAP